MADRCKEKDCTVGQTGLCLLNNDPKNCPQRIASETTTGLDVAAALGDLAKPAQNPTFPGVLALSLADASTLMSGRYCRLVGILGPPDAGKTALLVCVYLLLASDKLAGFEFRNSSSLMALEEISRGARRWKVGDPPGALTQHTQAKGEREAGFLHFRLAQREGGEVVDILFPDLPGEWSTSLIDSNRSDRLDFLRSADVIWVMLDGLELTERSKRQTALHRIALLLQRVRTLFVDTVPPVRLVISRRDKGELAPHNYQTLVEEAARLGIVLSVSQIASFSEDDAVAPGAGISELLTTVFDTIAQNVETWPVTSSAADARQMLRFRKR
jgi:hypothetical protein